ncbi:hypothetical protein M2306_000464 [Myroides gitamensis]|nr:hypothetical protein [Myroides odoratus]MCS4238972.1 hypothetical protein [Myroides odoratus]MDH6599770.1 hypothetical protein [Myroides gitamensis]
MNLVPFIQVFASKFLIEFKEKIINQLDCMEVEIIALVYENTA